MLIVVCSRMVFALQALSRLTWRTLNTAMKSSFNPHIFSSVSRAISSTDSINEQMGLLGNAAKRASDLRFRCAEFIKRCEESSNDGSVDLSIGQDVAEIKLNNPKKRNAFSGEELLDYLTAAAFHQRNTRHSGCSVTRVYWSISFVLQMWIDWSTSLMWNDRFDRLLPVPPVLHVFLRRSVH